MHIIPFVDRPFYLPISCRYACHVALTESDDDNDLTDTDTTNTVDASPLVVSRSTSAHKLASASAASAASAASSSAASAVDAHEGLLVTAELKLTERQQRLALPRAALAVIRWLPSVGVLEITNHNPEL
jgi:hypothetical protein